MYACSKQEPRMEYQLYFFHGADHHIKAVETAP
jgi:hypothetical protein